MFYCAPASKEGAAVCAEAADGIASAGNFDFLTAGFPGIAKDSPIFLGDEEGANDNGSTVGRLRDGLPLPFKYDGVCPFKLPMLLLRLPGPPCPGIAMGSGLIPRGPLGARGPEGR